jgi:hypothetical protein
MYLPLVITALSTNGLSYMVLPWKKGDRPTFEATVKVLSFNFGFRPFDLKVYPAVAAV